MDEDLKAYLEDMKRELRADIERVETSLLTEFHKWSSPLEMRVKSHALALRALDLEVDALGERIQKLEPPPAH
jgi:polyhydroxyalkanoate synthesis regulator phasin